MEAMFTQGGGGAAEHDDLMTPFQLEIMILDG
jgi:hypothetical protein